MSDLTSKWEKCPRCNGQGFERPQPMTVPYNLLTCTACKGSGHRLVVPDGLGDRRPGA
jgi:DnaJ-class molecular chaperone